MTLYRETDEGYWLAFLPKPGQREKAEENWDTPKGDTNLKARLKRLGLEKCACGKELDWEDVKREGFVNDDWYPVIEQWTDVSLICRECGKKVAVFSADGNHGCEESEEERRYGMLRMMIPACLIE